MLLCPAESVAADNLRQRPAPSHRPTVCQLLHTLTVGGAEVLADRIARRLGDRYRFVFACLDEVGPIGERLRADGYAVHHLGRRPGLDWRCPLRLATVLRNERVDVVHAHQYTPFFYALAARLRGPRRPVLFTEHGRHQPDFPRRKRKIANRLLMSAGDRVVGVGEAVRKALVVNEGLAEGRVGVLYNGINLDQHLNSDREAARNELAVGRGEFVMLLVARLDYLKDHGTALRTLARVAGHRSQTRLVLVGDGPERPTIEAAAKKLGVADKLTLLGTRDDVARLLPGADLFLLTSISEGIPLTPIEAMAAGLPVVATDVGGVREVVADCETGLLAPARDDAALAALVLRLAEDPALARRYGAAGRQRAVRLFDERRMCADYDRHYAEMAGV